MTYSVFIVFLFLNINYNENGRACVKMEYPVLDVFLVMVAPDPAGMTTESLIRGIPTRIQWEPL